MDISPKQITIVTATVFIVSAITAVGYYEFNIFKSTNPLPTEYSEEIPYRSLYNADQVVNLPRYSEEFDEVGYDTNRYSGRDSMPNYDPFKRIAYNPTVGGTRCCNCQTRLRYTRRK